MADLLRKIERPGSSRPLQYAVRDVRGVEAPAAAPAERTGFNEEAEWTARADSSLLTQHDAQGRHGGLLFPRAVVAFFLINNTLYIETAWRDGVWHTNAAPLVSVSGTTFTFAQPFSLAAEIVVQPEWPVRALFTVLGPTQIRIDDHSGLDQVVAGYHNVLSIYEV